MELIKTKTRDRALSVKKDRDRAQRILDYFNGLEIDETWTFEGYTQRDTSYITHGYHRYPAKFIPQLANRLIRELSSAGNLVVDPFKG